MEEKEAEQKDWKEGSLAPEPDFLTTWELHQILYPWLPVRGTPLFPARLYHLVPGGPQLPAHPGTRSLCQQEGSVFYPGCLLAEACSA